MLKQPQRVFSGIRDGGGNLQSDNSIILRRTAAIGDCLAATCVSDKLIERGYSVTYQAHSDIHCVLRRLRKKVGLAIPNGFAHINLDGAYENDPQRRGKHFSQMFLEVANQQMHARGLNLGLPFNCKPKISVFQSEKAAALNKFRDYARPWVFICPRSDTYNVRQVPDGIWAQAAAMIKGTKFWIGRHPGPPGIVDLGCRHLDNLIAWLSAADLLLSVDTGPMHIAAAMGIPIVAINQSSSPDLHLNDQNDFVSISPTGLDCLNCQQNICRIHQHIPPCQNVNPQLIADWANARLRSRFNDDVSAVISIYRPEAHILNRCLQSVVDQVQEVVVVRDLYGRLPDGAMQHPKIRYVVKQQDNIGYGRKCNYGVRFTNGRWVVFVNDDAWLNPDCIQRLMEAARPDTGIVSPLLYYPDRTIYHAGKIRSPGVRGWGHIDHRKHLPTFTNPVEMENVCGAVMMIRRQAFYDADGFDEDYFLYAEDDSMCLQVRSKGWKIVFTPQAIGWHDEHLSTSKTPDIVEIMNRSNALFTKKWAAYLDWNANRTPIGNFDYQRNA